MNTPYINAYFKSIGNAIEREERQRINESPRFCAEIAAQAELVRFEVLSKRLPHHWNTERGGCIAPNLRGTLRNTAAPIEVLQSLTADLKWCNDKLAASETVTPTGGHKRA